MLDDLIDKNCKPCKKACKPKCEKEYSQCERDSINKFLKDDIIPQNEKLWEQHDNKCRIVCGSCGHDMSKSEWPHKNLLKHKKNKRCKEMSKKLYSTIGKVIGLKGLQEYSEWKKSKGEALAFGAKRKSPKKSHKKSPKKSHKKSPKKSHKKSPKKSHRSPKKSVRKH
jgi:hypothetical protein